MKVGRGAIGQSQTLECTHITTLLSKGWLVDLDLRCTRQYGHMATFSFHGGGRPPKCPSERNFNPERVSR